MGLWVGRNGSDYFAHPAKPGKGFLINIFEFRPSGSDVAFHMHPFFALPQGLSSLDLAKAARNSVLLVSISRYGPDWADYQR